jgi:hypothetical protein
MFVGCYWYQRTKNPAAVALERLGGLKGGKARAATFSSRQRTPSADAQKRLGKASVKNQQATSVHAEVLIQRQFTSLGFLPCQN